MVDLSVIIPSRNEQFLPQTVNDLFVKADGKIEVIVVLDGYWPEPILQDNPALTIIHRGKSMGMRPAINAGVAIANGKWVMKTDAHCLFSEGFDKILKKDCEDDWVVIPRRYSLDAEKWERRHKPPIDYMYLSFPDDPQDWGGAGYHGRVWRERNRDETLKEIKIDDAMSFQGSCWFMHRDYFHFLDLMDEENYGPFWQEAQEIGPKCWFSGGRVVRNKKAWYAHLHKGKQYGRGYFLNKNTGDKAVRYNNKFMVNPNWSKQIEGRDLKWLVHHFWPIPGWPEKWGNE